MSCPDVVRPAVAEQDAAAGCPKGKGHYVIRRRRPSTFVHLDSARAGPVDCPPGLERPPTIHPYWRRLGT